MIIPLVALLATCFCYYNLYLKITSMAPGVIRNFKYLEVKHYSHLRDCFTELDKYVNWTARAFG